MVVVQGSGQRHLPGGTHQCWGSPRSWGVCDDNMNPRSNAGHQKCVSLAPSLPQVQSSKLGSLRVGSV